MVNFKHYKKSYIKKRSYKNPKEKLTKHKRRLTKIGNASVFSGIVYCPDCGAKLHFATCKNYDDGQDHYRCANYKSAMGLCATHFILVSGSQAVFGNSFSVDCATISDVKQYAIP